MNDQEAPKQMSGCAKAAIGCGIATLILLIILALGAWYVAKNAKAWTAGLISTGMTEIVDQSTLPDEQKQAIKDRISHVKDEFVAGNISAEQIADAINNLDLENLIAAGFTQYVGSGIIESSQLSDDEKALGKQAMNRVATGVLDGSIHTHEIEQALAPIMQKSGANNWEFKQNPTPEELQQALENANDLADKAGIPQDVEQVDFGKRVEEAFDEALGTP